MIYEYKRIKRGLPKKGMGKALDKIIKGAIIIQDSDCVYYNICPEKKFCNTMGVVRYHESKVDVGKQPLVCRSYLPKNENSI